MVDFLEILYIRILIVNNVVNSILLINNMFIRFDYFEFQKDKDYFFVFYIDINVFIDV